MKRNLCLLEHRHVINHPFSGDEESRDSGREVFSFKLCPTSDGLPVEVMTEKSGLHVIKTHWSSAQTYL